MSTDRTAQQEPREEDLQATNAAKVLSFIAAHEARHGHGPEPAFYLSGADEGDRIELSKDLYLLLKQIAADISAHRSVQIMPLDKELTTQQAADMLDISRPTVVALIRDGKLPATVPGRSRHKIRLSDLMDYRDQLYQQRNDFIGSSSEAYATADEVSESETASLIAQARKKRASSAR